MHINISIHTNICKPVTETQTHAHAHLFFFQSKEQTKRRTMVTDEKLICPTPLFNLNKHPDTTIRLTDFKQSYDKARKEWPRQVHHLHKSRNHDRKHVDDYWKPIRKTFDNSSDWLQQVSGSTPLSHQQGVKSAWPLKERRDLSDIW